MLTCDCGYALTDLSGNRHDRAACLQCHWTAAGPAAEHAGYHHHLATRHRWTLTPFQPE